jgi:hypothetical protein
MTYGTKHASLAAGSISTQGKNMENEDHDGKQEQLEEHSLPGTNQARKGPSSCEKNDQENRPGGVGAQHQDQLEEHSLPGTNQAGKEPGSFEKNDRAAG